MMNMRFVIVKDTKYLRLDDVQEFIRALASGEETDVRNRINQAAHSLGFPLEPSKAVSVADRKDATPSPLSESPEHHVARPLSNFS